MIDIHDGEIKDIIPINLMSPEVEAISFAVGQALRRLREFAASSSLYVEIGKVPEYVLDLMALELNTQYYEQSLPRNVKEALIRQTIPWYMHAGTVPVLEEFLNTVLDGGTITEWFRYDGEPYHFKALVKVGEHEIPLGYGRKITQQINVYKNLRSWLEALVFQYAAECRVPIRYDNCLQIQSEFYPRYNMAHHYLEGAHYLDGDKALNSYAVDEALDFYPVTLLVGGGVRQDTVASSVLKVGNETHLEVCGNNLLSICAGTHQEVFGGALMDVGTACEVSGSVVAETKSQTHVACEVLAERSLSVVTDTVVAVGGIAEMMITFGCRVFVGADCNLTVEDNLRFLDDCGYLDGENTLNADVFHYHL